MWPYYILSIANTTTMSTEPTIEAFVVTSMHAWARVTCIRRLYVMGHFFGARGLTRNGAGRDKYLYTSPFALVTSQPCLVMCSPFRHCFSGSGAANSYGCYGVSNVAKAGPTFDGMERMEQGNKRPACVLTKTWNQSVERRAVYGRRCKFEF